MSSFRSQFVTKRSYNRPLDEDGTIFETFTQTIDRVISHQRWLWETAKGKLIGEDIDQLTEDEEAELEEMRILLLNHEATVSGRTLWLGGTDISKKYHATQFNCSFGQIRTVHDFVDAFHNLLLGVGVGFEPITGILNGFARPVEIEIVRSTRKDRGDDNNREKHYRRGDKRVWHLYIGDSGIAWAKAAGKLVAMKKPVDIVILDFSEVRPGGKPLRGFGWISSGDAQISEAFYEIAQILNRRFGQLLSRIDVLDILNWLGTSLSSRRSAEIAIMPADDPEAEEFAIAKKDYWKTGNKQRAQSNNSLIFYHKPTKRELRGLFSQMLDSGGSEPGFINGAAARKRAPWFRGVNPCGEILLGEKSYCNLVTINLAKFNGRWEELNRAFWIMGRANYRQTCVDFRDGILQETWHELNQFLRLTGVGCAGIVMWEHQKSAKHLQQLREAARLSVNSMAMELNLPDSKAVTCIKPDGCTILSTKIKLQTGDILSMEEIFELNGFNREFLALVGEKVWLQPEKELNVIDENNEEQKITKLYVNGIKPVYEIEFEDGNIYKFTGNHKLKTLTGWKRVDELTPDDNIISF